ncbi:hypothetical protein [Lactobacillus intestinalis]|uniref:hypothetical protein n=1 Tax=Lactobacillus intestinalis TaxID=151781 RepID=UPI0025A994F6|nr:hypothetical protein [Lactobacillus intestinalis]
MTSLYSLIISGLAFSLSLYSAINTYYEKHIKTQLYLRWIYFKGNQLNVCLLISNMSSRPSTITNIYFKNEIEKVESSWFPVKLVDSQEPNTNKTKATFSDCTPLNIPPRSAKTFVISFQYLNSNQFCPNSKLNLDFEVNGTTVEKELIIKKVLDTSEYSIALKNRLK